MGNRTIELRSDLVERLETLAEYQGRSLDEVFGDLLSTYALPPASSNNWALAVAEGMEAADIQWLDDPGASANSCRDFKQHLYEKWRAAQDADGENG
jgi:predicted transcriptional regulator